MLRNEMPAPSVAVKCAVSIAALSIGMSGGVALAQDDRSEAVAEVVVTANRYEQNLQDVPAPISAFNQQALEERGVTNAQDLQFLAPGLTIGRTNANQAQVTIRGVGTENIGVGGDPGVTLYVDGHYVSAPNFVTQSFYDVGRIEVLRGPQGTLYGRNAIGGAINIITNQPTSELQANISGEVANYDGHEIRGVLSGPITNGLSGRIVAVKARRDGYIENLTDGERVDKSDYTAVRGALLFEPTESAEFRLGAYAYKNRGNLPNVVVSPYNLGNPIPNTFGIPNPFAQAGAPNAVNPTVANRRQIRNDVPPRSHDEARGFSFDSTFEFGDFTLKSLFAYNRNQNHTTRDIDGSDIVFTNNTVDFDFEGYSEEIQLLYDRPGLHAIAGLYAFKEASDLDYFFSSYSFFTGTTPPTTDTSITGRARSKSYGVFAQVDWEFAPRWQLIAGLRYSWDQKRFAAVNDYRSLGFFAETPPGTQDSWDNLSARLGVNYHATDDLMVFVSLANGYKAGGYNVGVPFTAYLPEKVANIEAGFKSELFDRRLRLNASAFYSDYSDKQDFNIFASLPVMLNAAAATIYGLDIEARLRATDSLTLDATASLLHAEYDSFSTLDAAFPSLGVQDLSGNRLARAPKYTAALGAQYDWSLGAHGALSARVDAAFIGGIYYRAFNTPRDYVDAYHRTNARLTWTDAAGRFDVSIFVENIEDEDVIENLLISDNNLGANTEAEFLPPRTYGVRFGYSF